MCGTNHTCILPAYILHLMRIFYLVCMLVFPCLSIIISRVLSIPENLKIHHLLNCSLRLEYTFLNPPLFYLYIFKIFLGLKGYNFCDFGDSFTKRRYLNRILCIRMGIQQIRGVTGITKMSMPQSLL